MYDIQDTSATIREIQRYLRRVGRDWESPRLPSVDGIYGEETREAVRHFQETAGLPINGEVDGATFAALVTAFFQAEQEEAEVGLLPSSAFPLHLGDSGNHIRILQSVLTETGDGPLPIDGFFGRDTEDAVRRAQRRHGLSPTGSANLTFWRRISAEYFRETDKIFSQIADA